MPHLRTRIYSDKLLKKLNYSPVVVIQGARQTGKSYFVRELLPNLVSDSMYLSFDQDSTKEFAQRDVESFLARYQGPGPLIIDEAQKVPKIFDAIKFVVDGSRIPGSFILLGSTEFSKLSLIRESLTGRVSKIRFFPFTLAEALERKSMIEKKESFYLAKTLKITRKEFLKHLEQGGLPGVFTIRNAEEKSQVLQDWIDLTVHRDVHQFPNLKADSELCLKIMKEIARGIHVTAGALSKELRIDLRKIKTHLLILEHLFVIVPVKPHPMGTGKPVYFLLDVGVANFLGAPMKIQLETLFLQEYLAKRAADNTPGFDRELYYYRTRQGAKLSFVEVTPESVVACQIFDEANLNKKHFYLMSAFLEAAKKESSPKIKLSGIVLLSNLNAPIPKEIKGMLWEHMG